VRAVTCVACIKQFLCCTGTSTQDTGSDALPTASVSDPGGLSSSALTSKAEAGTKAQQVRTGLPRNLVVAKRNTKSGQISGTVDFYTKNL